DIWSVGCILAELLGRRPLFKGRDYVDQLNQILHVLGTPTEETLKRVGSPRAQEYIRSLPFQPRIPFERLFPDANPLALDLLSKMLAFDPAERISCEAALQHPYLAVWHDPADEPVCQTKFDFGFEAVNDVPGMKALILEEVRTFRAEVRAQFQADLRAQQQQQQQQAAVAAAAAAAAAAQPGLPQPRRQESLPIPTRDEIRKSSPSEDHSKVLLGASNSLVHQKPQDGGAGQQGQELTDAEMLEDPAAMFERQLADHR
ncbi:mitogen activated protein kinase 2, partial [Tilletia horrida]